ncbi:MAG: short chain dehydrogenase [Gammaproteobacteria bacterium]
MKILIIGGTGTVGNAVTSELSKRHEIVVAGKKSGDIQVDITDINSIKSMYDTVGALDAVVACAGKVTFADFADMDDAAYRVGLNDKLMGQVNLVLIGRDYINKSGSFTLTSGILNRDPIAQGSSAAMVNGALDAFVKAVAFEMPPQLRINIVSATVLTEALPKYENYFRGYPSVAANKVALAYVKSVEGIQTGQIYCVDD